MLSSFETMEKSQSIESSSAIKKSSQTVPLSLSELALNGAAPSAVSSLSPSHPLFNDVANKKHVHGGKRSSLLSTSSGLTQPTAASAASSALECLEDSDIWEIECTPTGGTTPGMYAAVAQTLFPYHFVLNENLEVVAVGDKLARVLKCPRERILGATIGKIFNVTVPAFQEWNWDWLLSLYNEDRSFRVYPSAQGDSPSMLRFEGKAVYVASGGSQAMINLVPDVHSREDLREMELTENDLPSHGGYRELLDLREELDKEKSTKRGYGKTVGTLCKALSKEKSLLESLVPKHVAESFRVDESVPPQVHDNVTFFFSDVVGFTDMCKQLLPWQVVGMLNRLYCVMDYLADKFQLFKVETIGDAYVCCSGLPVSDPNHAARVANFAIAVSHCVKHVLSPVDRKPIQLRIGIHTGRAASGVVGVTSPRYCVFGDTVNITARHEGTGEAGRVHCSAVTQKALIGMGEDTVQSFHFIERGLVDMKGKGKLRTVWLEPSEMNEFCNTDGMRQLEAETDELLSQTKFESDLEKKTCEESLELVERLGSAQLSDKHQEVMGPILDIIRQELQNKGTQAVKAAPVQNEHAPNMQTLQARRASRSVGRSVSASDLKEQAVSQHSGEQRRGGRRSLKKVNSWDGTDKARNPTFH